PGPAVPAPGGRAADGGCELPEDGIAPLPPGLVAEAVLADFHSGIFFRSSAVLPILKPSFSPSHLKASTGSATRWLPTPSTPPSLTTKRSTVFDFGSISTVETLPIFLSSLP